MSPSRSIAQLYDSFLAQHDDARAAGVLESAFHALAGALSCGEALEDESRVQRVKILADRIRQALDRDRPEHRLATDSAVLRGQASAFASLSLEAESIASRIRAARAARTMTHDLTVPGSHEPALGHRMEPWPVSARERLGGEAPPLK